MPLHIEAIEQAAHDTVADFPGGANGILSSDLNINLGLNKSPHVLLNEVNPASCRHKLGLIDSVLLQQVTGDYSILLTYAGCLDHSIIPRAGNLANVSDMELLNTFTKWAASNGDVASAVNHALEDRRITRDEYKLVRMKYLAAVQSGFEFLERMQAVIDE